MAEPERIRIRASSLNRASVCPASVPYGAQFPDAAGEGARMGTAYHRLMEKSTKVRKMREKRNLMLF